MLTLAIGSAWRRLGQLVGIRGQAAVFYEIKISLEERSAQFCFDRDHFSQCDRSKEAWERVALYEDFGRALGVMTA